MSILCVDVGSSYGYAVLSAGEIVESGAGSLPGSRTPYGERWAAFRDRIRGILDDRPENDPPTRIVWERPFGKYVGVLRFQFGLGTVLELEAADRGIVANDVQPGEIKRFATGEWNCKKAKMTSALFERWEEFGIEPPPADIGEDEVDAIWLALYVATGYATETVS